MYKSDIFLYIVVILQEAGRWAVKKNMHSFFISYDINIKLFLYIDPKIFIFI